ncbi:branched-chain amino acid transaminase [Coriobacteriia bacterium Es71-Z0120]|uniref:branched-chain amino acid transaminase n=1 Tax=Parvivirga hydrogeniphila TaxID=2939460 RepID=UPI002260B5FA|nr:branched-chain amino acid transaminase [Parvivirga hydrogeniphila]MCL4078715.1 branched-chain amino acid transaminase [Parvivirga hydrogeniphila]
MAGLPKVDYIWMDGELVEWDKATVHVLTHALHYGSGVFEGIRCYATADGPAIFRLRDHMERFERSARMIMMDLAVSVDDLCEAVKETVRANNLPECYIRPIAFRGYGVMGLDPIPAPVQIVIAAWPWATYMGEEALTRGVDVGISSWRQRGINSLPPAVKATGNYLNSSLARIEANRHGYNEAILLNEEGKVCEGTGENIFIVRDGVISTPPVSDGILEGITRDSIMVIADELGYPVIEESLVRTDLYAADEVFMTGTAAEVVPVRSVDGRLIGDAGPVTLELQKTFFRVVHGEEPAYEEWLDRV